jgi:hypothetical protein
MRCTRDRLPPVCRRRSGASVAPASSPSERHILDAAASGITDRVALFRAAQRCERAPFMGDTIFYDYVARLASGPVPLLAGADGRFHLTNAGGDVHAGRADAIALNGIDRWLGGVHLHGERVWRWDDERPAIVGPPW